MTELEKKILISKDDYDHLLEYFGHGNKSVIIQTNYYFDTDDLIMNRKNITCRIRLINGSYEGTMKFHSVKSEKSTEIKIKINEGVSDNDFIDMGLKLQGSLITYRSIILKNEYCEAVLDKNEYLDKVDYELEIEYSEKHEKQTRIIYQSILDILNRKNNSFICTEKEAQKSKILSKSKRFFDEKFKLSLKNIKTPSNFYL